jgi:hypothetical protein
MSEKSNLHRIRVLGIRYSQQVNETFVIIQSRHSEQATGWTIQSSNSGRRNIFLSYATSRQALGSPAEWVLGFFHGGRGKTAVA